MIWILNFLPLPQDNLATLWNSENIYSVMLKNMNFGVSPSLNTGPGIWKSAKIKQIA